MSISHLNCSVTYTIGHALKFPLTHLSYKTLSGIYHCRNNGLIPKILKIALYILRAVVLAVPCGILWAVGKGITWLSKTQINPSGLKSKVSENLQDVNEKISRTVKDYKIEVFSFMYYSITKDKDIIVGESQYRQFVISIGEDIGFGIKSSHSKTFLVERKFVKWLFEQEYQNVNKMISFVKDKVNKDSESRGEYLQLLRKSFTDNVIKGKLCSENGEFNDYAINQMLRSVGVFK